MNTQIEEQVVDTAVNNITVDMETIKEGYTNEVGQWSVTLNLSNITVDEVNKDVLSVIATNRINDKLVFTVNEDIIHYTEGQKQFLTNNVDKTIEDYHKSITYGVSQYADSELHKALINMLVDYNSSKQ